MKQMFIGERGTNEKYRSLSNFLENFRQIALFVLSCKKIKFLRDICDFNSYISYPSPASISLAVSSPSRVEMNDLRSPLTDLLC